jgi:putative transposase
LLKGINADNVLADRAYDSNAIADWIIQHQSAVVIPSKKNRKVKREIDPEIYKNRNRIERLFCRLKQFRRVATRYEKLAKRYAMFVLITAAIVWGTW